MKRVEKAGERGVDAREREPDDGRLAGLVAQ